MFIIFYGKQHHFVLKRQKKNIMSVRLNSLDFVLKLFS